MAMGDCESGITTELEREEDLIAAAKQIARALGSRKSLTDEARKILSDLGTQLSSISIPKDEPKPESASEMERRLDSVQEKLMSWESDQSMIWESSFDDGFEYLTLVDEATELTDRLCSAQTGSDDHDLDLNQELQRRAHDLLQTAMDRLEEEFRHLLASNSRPFEPESLSFRSNEEESSLIADEASSILALDDIPAGDSFGRETSLVSVPSARLSGDFLIDVVSPEAVPELRAIAESMLRAKYGAECLQAYTGLRKDALDECLFVLEVEKLSIEDVIRTEWGSLNSKIKRWIRAAKVFVRVYLLSERRLCDAVFGEELGRSCFVESSKASVLRLLNFGEAMSVGPQKPEKLSRVLDMYETLAGLVPDIEALYSGGGDSDPDSFVAAEGREVLARLGYCVRATFLEFRNAIASNPSNGTIAGGGIHPLTRYVMNYIRTLTDYSETLDSLFDQDHETAESSSSPSPDSSPTKRGGGGPASLSPTALRFASLTEALERNLEAKSSLYKDAPLQHLFLMNNIHYMAQKVKSPELRAVFGDDWIRKRNGKFQQQAIDYQRSSWGSILSLLREEGSQSHGSSKSGLKERFKNFYAAFEEIYRVQTGWTIPDEELREDLRISTSLNVIQAYRIFEGRHFNHISEKYIKYNADDLERCLLDLFEGSPKTLPSQSRR